MKPLFIIGYMASGKTTFGRALAARLNLRFIDLDFYISQRFHASVPEIFSRHGEEYFRRIESNMLREAGEFEDVVIACGGGTPCHGDNIAYMNSRGTTILLDATTERTVSRILQAPGKRPLLAEKTPEELHGFITEHKAEREPYYAQAALRIPSDALETRAQIAGTVDAAIPLLPGE